MSEEFIFGGDGELPEALREILQSLKRKSMDSGLAHDRVADEITPSAEQLDLKPGDKVVLTHQAHAQSDLDEFLAAEVLDAEQYKDEFPDYGDRLMKAYVLCRWWTRSELEGQLGWFPRVELVKFPEEQWDHMCAAMRGDIPPNDEIPPWLITRYNEAMAAMAEVNPDHIAQPIACPKCGSYGFIMTISLITTKLFCMGTRPEDKGKPFEELEEMHATAQYKEDRTAVTKYECLACGAEGTVPDEVHIYG